MEWRILKEEHCGKITYVPQYKFLFWWLYDTMIDIGWHGESGTLRIDFDDLGDCQKYICSQKPSKILQIIEQ